MMRATGTFLSLSLFAAFAGIARAEDPPAPPIVNESEDVVAIVGAGGSAGRTAVNAAAGNLNQQTNVGVIAIGTNAVAIGSVTQLTDASIPQPSAYKSATIGGDAFARSTGMIAVNVAAGSGHQQANLAIIAIGIEGQVVTDAMLSQTRASNSPPGMSGQTTAPEVVAGISSGAFAGSSGLVQVSLVGGERNSSANIFALTSLEGTDQ
ncbi:hypothetical protein [Sphingosinicella rhizophila]|uniref:Uncharacterized protein n=1 Tax=Sphingosinicella rhizophila TaxID=3050082 RepID=A0ABU3Q6G1_9SPHN|nr:hypothetical protein [Sphingosinicella sp. GR2756]MDT9598991.1 hypothetical protein [Sphingosinicella sp. GR2756]